MTTSESVGWLTTNFVKYAAGYSVDYAAPGSAGDQSSGLTHWDRFKRQCHLTSNPRVIIRGGKVVRDTRCSVVPATRGIYKGSKPDGK